MGGQSLILLDTLCLIWMDQADTNPADCFIVAVTQALGANLVTADRRILTWTRPLERHDGRL